MKMISRCLVCFLIFALPATSFASAAGSSDIELRRVVKHPHILLNPPSVKSGKHGLRKQAGHYESPDEVDVGSAVVSVTLEADGIRIEWNSLEGSLVKLELYREDDLVEDISGWIENNGSFMFVSEIQFSSSSDDYFCIRVTDDSGNSTWSDNFLINATIVLTPPDAYITGGGPADVTIEWSGGGNPVCVELYREDCLIENLSGWIDNEGFFTWCTDVPGDWESSNSYYFRVSDTRGILGRSSYFTVTQIQGPESARNLHVGESVSGWFESPYDERYYRFEAKPLQAYRFCTEGDLELAIDILDPEGTVLFSSKTTPDDQRTGTEAAYWDCRDEGIYIARGVPLIPGETGEYTLFLDEVPGWQVAKSLSQFPTQEGKVDYPGDVDYFTFERIYEERVYEIIVEGNDQTVLFWVNTDDARPEALVEGSEISIQENYPGGDLTKDDSYYGVSGPIGCYYVEGSVSKDGGISAWVIVGVVGGIVCLILCFHLVQEANEGLDSCSGLFGDVGNIGCWGGGGE